MSAVKPPQQHSMLTLRGSLLTPATLTLFSFTFVSLNSLRRPPSLSTAADAPPALRLESPSQTSAEEDYSEVYHSAEIFKLNYAEMERKFKVYIYPDGDPKTFYQTPRKMTGNTQAKVISSRIFENRGFVLMILITLTSSSSLFLAIRCAARQLSLLLLIISLIEGTSYENMTVIVRDYVEGLIAKYPYWSRTLGADHFFVTCHDVGARATEGMPLLVKNSIRVVCSPSYNVEFIPHKDVALPQVLQPFALPAGGNDIENRTNLGFWAGHRNSKIRVILARVWENDTELDISNNRISRAIGPLVYQKRFYRNKFCICPGGSQVNSARITDYPLWMCSCDHI